MTFEEFFVKKKIDLGLLKIQQPALYDEFQLHFRLMGEKSFDHTKKYWFNRLRKDFLLCEETVTILPETKILTSNPSQNRLETPSGNSLATKPAGFKPRFKVGVTAAPKPADDVVPETTHEVAKPAEVLTNEETKTKKNAAVASKPVGFKPRFKAGVTATKPTDELLSKPIPEESNPVQETSDKETTQSDIPPAASKPTGFKPRFKAGVTTIKKDPPAENGV
ncbi:hypothetical protein SAMN05216436_10871 [bacterium A37T11]|nr:hypothetical protein SAMN05216436_10871 [bacterium A37T11]